MARPAGIERTGIERYGLYGEPAREAEVRFMHVERIAKRSGAHQWSIRPHAHADLHQILLLTGGGGAMPAEAAVHRFTAPALVTVPAGMVHGFEFFPGTDGLVATVAETFVTDATRGDPLIADFLKAPFALGPAGPELAAHAIPDAFEALAAEFTWAAPARMVIVEAHLIRILVGAARLALNHGPVERQEPSPDTVLVERFRRLIEQHYRDSLSLPDYAARLGVTDSRLTAACRRVHGEPAVKLILRRRLVEAQRSLLYTNLTVSEIGFFLGFQDPSYFSRFFLKLTGESPSQYRARRRTEGG
ncbi:AraC family transcriptional activator of pobA [Azospirillum fermentarium]|uniref:helix-turn-helix domain-containing protein n=1 Tax=Azospirillum fermentarium TaxID=1233114 RepID=UPI00222730A7|nr:helix-turn-helix domain-containing protein [Azospirillum fermentarium]MCW2248122.1 AraC family transcriptional activator of pobA [Azospirillum fermentarium]